MISLPVLLGVLLIGFLLLQVVPTDPATVVAGPTATKAEVDAIRNDLGLNQPLWVQFGRYLGRVFQLDLGRSMISNRAVVDEIALTLWPTVELMLACLIWAVPLGITLGTLAARRRGTVIDRAIMALSVMGVSVPVFWVGLLLIQYVGGAGLLPFQGRNGPIWTADGFLSIILPAVTLGAVFVGPVARMTRTSLLETLGADYVRTARAKGLNSRLVIAIHALPNAMLPVITLSGILLGFVLAGSIPVERAFGTPGLGYAMFTAVSERDIFVMQNLVFIYSCVFVVLNIVVDLAIAWLDPRIRLQ